VTATTTVPTGTGPEPGTGLGDTGLAERVAAAVSAHPAVARLDAGVFGEVATHRTGGRLIGVRIGQRPEPVEIGVVLHLGRPLPEVADALRMLVSAMCAGAPVDVTVADVEPDRYR